MLVRLFVRVMSQSDLIEFEWNLATLQFCESTH